MATILLAEDDADIRLLVTLKLTQAGHQVRGFGDGLSAAANAREHPPDLAVLDMMMPGMSGLEVCREMRSKGDAVSVLMLTARDAVDDRIAGFDAGADDYLTKPFAFAELLMRVKALLRRGPVSRTTHTYLVPAPSSSAIFAVSSASSWPLSAYSTASGGASGDQPGSSAKSPTDTSGARRWPGSREYPRSTPADFTAGSVSSACPPMRFARLPRRPVGRQSTG